MHVIAGPRVHKYEVVLRSSMTARSGGEECAPEVWRLHALGGTTQPDFIQASLLLSSSVSSGRSRLEAGVPGAPHLHILGQRPWVRPCGTKVRVK